MSFRTEEYVLFDPMDLSLFGTKAIVASANNCPHLPQQSGQVRLPLARSSGKNWLRRLILELSLIFSRNELNARYYTSEETLYKAAVRQSNYKVGLLSNNENTSTSC
jgi:hypothetical protein